MKLTYTLLTLMMAAMLVSCGGSDDSTTTKSSGQNTSGVFIDSKVVNLHYKTESISDGVTDADGKFNVLVGETITFSIGHVEADPVPVAAIITPFDLAGSDDINNRKVVNILTLLQSLDDVGDLTDGIQISDRAHSEADADMGENFNFDQPIDDFIQDQYVIRLIGAGNIVTTESAKAHFSEVIDLLDTTVISTEFLQNKVFIFDGDVEGVTKIEFNASGQGQLSFVEQDDVDAFTWQINIAGAIVFSETDDDNNDRLDWVITDVSLTPFGGDIDVRVVGQIDGEPVEFNSRQIITIE